MKPQVPLHDTAFRYTPSHLTGVSKNHSSVRSPIQRLLDRVAVGLSTADDAAQLANALGIVWSKP